MKIWRELRAMGTTEPNEAQRAADREIRGEV